MVEKSLSDYQKYKDKIRVYNAVWRERHPEKTMLISARVRARKYGLAFTLVETDIKIPKICPALGIPIFAKCGSGAIQRNGPNSPSLDRINPALGYTPDNVQVLSWRANDLKKDATARELRLIADFVAKQDQ